MKCKITVKAVTRGSGIVCTILILALAINRFAGGRIKNFQDFIVTLYFM